MMLALRRRLSDYRLDIVMAIMCQRARIPWPEMVRIDSQTWMVRTWLEVAMISGEPIGDPPYHLWVSDDDELVTLVIGESIARGVADLVTLGDRSFRRLDKDHYESLRLRCRGRTDESVKTLATAIETHGKAWERAN